MSEPGSPSSLPSVLIIPAFPTEVAGLRGKADGEAVPKFPGGNFVLPHPHRMRLGGKNVKVPHMPQH